MWSSFFGKLSFFLIVYFMKRLVTSSCVHGFHLTANKDNQWANSHQVRPNLPFPQSSFRCRRCRGTKKVKGVEMVCFLLSC